ncbi:MAG: AAA family ATPase [Ruthenibacterium sp.]
MIQLGEEITLRASAKKMLWTDGVKKSICLFSARVDPDRIPTEIKAYGYTQVFKAKGQIADIPVGTLMQMTGTWVDNKTFEVTSSGIAIPKTDKELTTFLHKNCRGVGAAIAARIVDEFGANTLSVCTNNRPSLLRIKGVSEQMAGRIIQACKRVVYRQELDKLIGDAKLPQVTTNKLIDEYGERVCEVIRRNPYLIIGTVSFSIADKIALFLGESSNSTRRICAGMKEAQWTLAKSSGSLCTTRSDIVAAATKWLGDVSQDSKEKAVDALLLEHSLVKQGKFLYSKADFVCEKRLAFRIALFAAAKKHETSKVLEAFNQWKTENNTIVLSSRQEEAVLKSLTHAISVITGGPGTGKTTVLKAIMEVYKKVFPKEDILLMAPTALAAKAMNKKSGMPAMTIHSACGLIPASNNSGFVSQSDDEVRLTQGLIAVDEVSMVGVHLAHFIMDAVAFRENTRIVLIGDVDQLHPVSQGNILDDLIHCGAVETTFLDRNYRQGEDSSIVDAVLKINAGDTSLAFTKEFEFIEEKSSDVADECDKIARTIVNEYEKNVGLFGKDGTIVLSPMRIKGLLCSDVLNVKIQERINPARPDIASCKITHKVFREGDRVIQTKSTQDAINGDLGIIVSIKTVDSSTEVEIDFDGKSVIYDMQDMGNVDLAYCISVHKSQGSEFPCCIMPASKEQKVMLVRRLYYTGVSRAKKHLVLVGDKAALDMAIRNNKEGARKSLLGPRIIVFTNKIRQKA